MNESRTFAKLARAINENDLQMMDRHAEELSYLDAVEQEQLLMTAIERENVVALDRLIGYGLDPRLAWSSAIEGAQYGEVSLDIVRRLLEAGVSADTPVGNGRTALTIASHSCSTLCRILLEYGAAVNRPSGKGWTPLMFAAATDSCIGSAHDALERVRLLLGAGADVSIADPEGQRAIDIARQQGFDPEISHEIVQMLNDRA